MTQKRRSSLTKRRKDDDDDDDVVDDDDDDVVDDDDDDDDDDAWARQFCMLLSTRNTIARQPQDVNFIVCPSVGQCGGLPIGDRKTLFTACRFGWPDEVAAAKMTLQQRSLQMR
jgi:hypothetical protein